MFYSTQQALLRYIRLYQMLGTVRSIPLKKGGTHVSRTDSTERWNNIRHEFAILCCIFPKSHSTEWYLLIVNQHTNLMPYERRERLEELTGRTWSQYYFDRETDRLYGRLTQSLRNHNLLIEQEEIDDHTRSSRNC